MLGCFLLLLHFHKIVSGYSMERFCCTSLIDLKIQPTKYAEILVEMQHWHDSKTIVVKDCQFSLN